LPSKVILLKPDISSVDISPKYPKIAIPLKVEFLNKASPRKIVFPKSASPSKVVLIKLFNPWKVNFLKSAYSLKVASSK